MLSYAKTLMYIDAILLVFFLGYRFALIPGLKNLIQNRVLVIILLTPAVALFCRNVHIFYIYLFAAAAFGSRSKSDVCATYLVLITLCPSLPINLQAGSTYLLSISTLHIISLGSLLGYFLARGRPARGYLALDLLIWVPVVFMTISAFQDFKLLSLARLAGPASLLVVVPYWLASRSIRTSDELNKVLVHFLLAATLAAGIAIFEAVRMWPLYQAYLSALNMPLGISKTLAVRGGSLRAVGSFLDYTALGLYLAAALAIVPGVWHNFGRMTRFGVLAVIAMGLLATQSRGAWVGGAAGLAVMMIGRGKFGALFAGLAAAAAALAAKSLLSAKAGIVGGAAGAETAQYRVDLFMRGLQEVIRHPLWGQSRLSLQTSMADMMQSQGIIDFVNTHLHVALTMGGLGLACWLAMWLTPAGMAWRAARGPGRRLAFAPALMPVAMLASTFVALIFTSMVDRNPVWLAVALGLAAPCIAATRQEAALRSQQQPREGRVGWPAAQGRRLPRPAVLLPR